MSKTVYVEILVPVVVALRVDDNFPHEDNDAVLTAACQRASELHQDGDIELHFNDPNAGIKLSHVAVNEPDSIAPSRQSANTIIS